MMLNKYFFKYLQSATLKSTQALYNRISFLILNFTNSRMHEKNAIDCVKVINDEMFEKD